MLVRNQRGSILVVVLVVVFCLSIIGVSLAGLSLNDQRQTVRQQKDAEALYIARGGAEAVAAYILKNPEAAPGIIAQGQDEVILENGTRFVVKVSESETGQLRIESTGYSGNYSEMVALSLDYSPEKLTVPLNPVLDMAVFAEGNINIHGIIGDGGADASNIGTNSIKQNSINIKSQGKIYGDVLGGAGGNINEILNNGGYIRGNTGTLDEERKYLLPIFPDFPAYLPGRGNLTVNGTTTVSASGKYGTISLDKNSELKVATGASESEIEIYVNKLEIGNSGKITLVGNGKLILYVEDTFDLKNSASINLGGNPNRIIVYYKGTNRIKTANSSVLCGCMYAKTADIDVANGGDIAGSIFTGGAAVELKNSSHVRVVYAPYATVTLHNSGNVDGAIVCWQFDAKNKSRVNYHADVDGIWNIIPDVEFDLVEVERPSYLKGSWSN
ncbi:MAG: DUF7305 domain-containing protein [Bacillota bacterium]|jgi:hypothetical protein